MSAVPNSLINNNPIPLINGFQIIDTPDYLRYELSPDNLELKVYIDNRTVMLVVVGGLLGGAAGAFCTRTAKGTIGGASLGAAVVGSCRSYVVYTSRQKESKNFPRVVREGNRRVQQKIETLAQVITRQFNVLDRFLSDDRFISSNARAEIKGTISHELMSKPVQANCPHIFDYSKILEWLATRENEGRPQDCPLCRVLINRDEIKYSYETALKTIVFVKKIKEVVIDPTTVLPVGVDRWGAMLAVEDLRENINRMTDTIFNNSVRVVHNHCEFEKIHEELTDWQEANKLT